MPVFDFTSPDGKTYSVEGPEGATQEQAFQMLQQHLGSSAQPEASLGEDIAKSAGAGLANATAGTLGMVGDVRDLRNTIAGDIANRLGIPQSVQSAVGKGLSYLPTEALINRLPNSRDVIASAPDPIVDPNYQPRTLAGGYTKTGAEFLPGMLMGGPRDLGKRFLTNVAGPAVVSETAGQLTKGEDIEPYARTIGALAGGAGATRFANASAEARALKAATPGLSTVKNEATSTYDALTARNVATPLAQSTLDNLADDITTTLNNKGIRPSNAESIHRAVSEIKMPATVGAADVADLVAARQSIKELLGNHDTNKTGAFIALGKIERAIEQNSSGTMAKIKEADKNYAAAKANEALDQKIARAELRAAGDNSGLNLGNKIRQKAADMLLSSDAKYLSASTKAELEKIVRGTLTQNGMRLVSNALGGGGGLGSTLLGLTGSAAGAYSGHPELAALPLAGVGLRMATNRSVMNQATRAAEAIRRASPMGQRMVPALPQPDSVSLAALRAGLLGRPH